MNTKQPTRPVAQAKTQNVNRVSPPQMRRKRPSLRLLKTMRTAMAILGGLIVLMGLLLLILPMFRVKNIEVVGNNYYTREQITTGAGIAVDDEMLTLNAKDISKRIYDSCEYVSGVKITRYFSKIRIAVTEYPNVTVTEHNGTYYTLNSDLKVLAAYESAETLSDSFIPVKLPSIAKAEVGQPLVFSDSEVDMSYVSELISSLESFGTLANVTSLDCSKKYSVSYVLGNTARVELGQVGEMQAKLKMVDTILARKADAESCSVVDVSNLQKPTYRAVTANEI